MSAIARIYYRLVVNGSRTIDDVPTRWREEVQKLLDEDN